MHVARLAAVLVALVVLTGGCWQTEDDFYQYRTVTYSVSVVGPYDTFTVWYTNGGDARDIREVRPDSPEWRTTVKGEFYEVTGLELRADAYLREENGSPVPARVSCAIEVDGTVYKRSEKSIHPARSTSRTSRPRPRPLRPVVGRRLSRPCCGSARWWRSRVSSRRDGATSVGDDPVVPGHRLAPRDLGQSAGLPAIALT
jgi:hypothetical protein